MRASVSAMAVVAVSISVGALVLLVGGALSQWLAGRASSRRSAGRNLRVGSVVAGALRAVRDRHPRMVAGFARRDLASLVESAGIGERLTVRDVAAARIICVLLAVALLPRVAAALPVRALPAIALGVVFVAAESPVWWLKRLAGRRATSIRETLPDSLELLRACLGAGLPLRRSLVLVADHSADPVAGEFACVAAETALGVPQSTALDGLAARNPQPEIRSLVAAIRQAEKHGSPLAPVIAAQAEDARLALNREIVERGARAAPKIQLIVSVVIVPSALLGFAAVLIAAMAQGRIQFF